MADLQNKERAGVEESVYLKSFELVTENLVKEALRKSIGSDAELLSFEVIPFTNLGDNYSSVVACILVKYIKNETKSEESFVAKLNPIRPFSDFSEPMEQLYARETIVLSTIIEGMSRQLEKLQLDKIRTPRLFSRNLEKGREAFVTENLRKQGFKMYDRRKGMDLNHALLVVKEIGRFHASSILYEETLYPENILDKFEGYWKVWMNRNHASFEGYCKMFTGPAESAKNFFKNAGSKYETLVKWLSKHSDGIVEYYLDIFSPKEPFRVFAHCDCWTNNMLFRYNEDEIPVDIRFVDLQMAAITTPATDLNYFFYTSLNGDFRLKNLSTLVTAYYESFSYVLKRAGKEPPFTYQELKQELRNRKLFSVTIVLFVLPIILAEGDEMWDIENCKSDEMDEFNEKQNKKFEKLSQRGGPFNERYISMFDEMVNDHVFDED